MYRLHVIQNVKHDEHIFPSKTGKGPLVSGSLPNALHHNRTQLLHTLSHNRSHFNTHQTPKNLQPLHAKISAAYQVDSKLQKVHKVGKAVRQAHIPICQAMHNSQAVTACAWLEKVPDKQSGLNTANTLCVAAGLLGQW
jgi:hypothetical protein